MDGGGNPHVHTDAYGRWAMTPNIVLWVYLLNLLQLEAIPLLRNEAHSGIYYLYRGVP